MSAASAMPTCVEQFDGLVAVALPGRRPELPAFAAWR